jgi:general secretion pathway protein D
MTDTQTNIRRIAEIIRALDTSISSISTMHVFALRYADAKDMATTLTQLFATDASSSSRQNNNQGGGPAAFFGGFGRGGGGNNNAQPTSEARKAAARVVAVADSQSNSVVVSAPDEYMPTITEIVSRLDTNITEVTETRIYRLEHADATELSNILATLYPDTSSSSQSGNRGGQGGGFGGGGFGGFGGFGGGRQTQTQSQQSDRSVLQARVITVPDPRTNSVIVTASHETMEQVALTIGRLDASDSKKQHVYVHVLEHADPDNVATVLRGMFGDTTSTSTSSQPASNALNQRTTTGASADVTGTLNTSGSGTSGRSGSTGR